MIEVSYFQKYIDIVVFMMNDYGLLISSEQVIMFQKLVNNFMVYALAFLFAEKMSKADSSPSQESTR